eukprot:SAG11_NODE_14027_length_628_cov_0.931947_1_plen_123_part_10
MQGECAAASAALRLRAVRDAPDHRRCGDRARRGPPRRWLVRRPTLSLARGAANSPSSRARGAAAAAAAGERVVSDAAQVLILSYVAPLIISYNVKRARPHFVDRCVERFLHEVGTIYQDDGDD